MKISIDLDELKDLAQEGKQICLRPEGEEVLLRLLEAQEVVNAAIEEAKRVLEAEALKLSPDFQAIRSDHLTVQYRACGPKYRVEESLLETVPDHLYISRTTYTLLSEAIDEYARSQGQLPVGIAERVRPKQIVLSRRGTEDGEP